MSLFEQLLQNADDHHLERLTAWAAWKAKQDPPDPEAVGKRGQPVVWRKRPEATYEGAFELVQLQFVEDGDETMLPVIGVRSLNPTDLIIQKYAPRQFWMTYYEDIDWEQRTIDEFPAFFAQRRGVSCETCPAMGKMTMHHKRRSTKECEVSDLLARFQFKDEPIDERILMGEMRKGLWICRSCHDRVHKLEKRLSNPKAHADYIKALRHQESVWLDVDRIIELAELSAT